MKDLLTVHIAAQRLCVSRKRVYQLIQAGHLDSMRPSPRVIRITRESLDRYIEDAIQRERRHLGLDLGPLPRGRTRN